MLPRNPRKRQFQRSISSFFPPAAHDTTTSARTSATRPQTSIPILPDTVQSSLLNVGMRVRKAVPEGYKTHKDIEESRYNHDGGLDMPGRHLATIASNTAGRAAELVPFCGILRVGGYRVQELDGHGCNGGFGGEYYEGPPDSVLASTSFGLLDDTDCGFPSSQDTMASTISTDSMPDTLLVNLPTRGKKRDFAEEEDGNGEDDVQVPGNMHNSPWFPRSPPTTRNRTSRISLQFRSRRHNKPPVTLPQSRSTATVHSIPDFDFDFGEADFLKPDPVEQHTMDLDEI